MHICNKFTKAIIFVYKPVRLIEVWLSKCARCLDIITSFLWNLLLLAASISHCSEIQWPKTWLAVRCCVVSKRRYLLMK